MFASSRLRYVDLADANILDAFDAGISILAQYSLILPTRVKDTETKKQAGNTNANAHICAES